MYWLRAPPTTLSAAWEGGVRDGTIDGLRNRREDFCETRRGKKAWRAVNGATRLVLRMSDQSGGESEVIGLTGRVIAGRNTKEFRWRL